MRTVSLLIFMLCIAGNTAFAQTNPPQRNYRAPVEGDYIIQNFHFRSGETLPELKMHYRTIGTLKTNAAGVAQNAVLIGHGTGGAGTQFLNPIFANVFLGQVSFLMLRSTSSSCLTASVMVIQANRVTDCTRSSRTTRMTIWWPRFTKC